ncbi:CD1375 family protein [Bacillus sp. V2I10]|nr:CD1375 family protein [Bacillus sp. V2I10]
MLAMLYATYIMKGKWTYSNVPEQLKPQVKHILIDEGLGHLTEEGA